MLPIDSHSIQKIFRKRQTDSHKGNYGHALIIAGSKTKMGAALIATKACLRSGAGLVTANIPRKERQAFFAALPEAMVTFREAEKTWNNYNAFAIGPGISTDKHAEQLLKLLINNVSSPTVFDADALNLLAQNQEQLSQLPAKSILTPHVKEFDRLFGNHETQEERREKAIAKAAALGLIIVLKGHKTIVTDGTQIFENTTGNSGLAKGGSGDALTGIITAFLAQGYQPIEAAQLGVYLHGLAADITLETQSPESMLITDVIDNLGKAFHKIQ